MKIDREDQLWSGVRRGAADECWELGHSTQKDLARAYGVTQTQISKITTGRCWAGDYSCKEPQS